MAKIDDIFAELKRISEEWMIRDELPCLSEFIQSSVILVRKSNNELISFFPHDYSEYSDYLKSIPLEHYKDVFRVPTIEDNVDNKIFELCESQYEFQMWGLKIQKDLKKLNNKEISLDEFSEKHPDIEKK